jgi:hypothetical protein
MSQQCTEQDNHLQQINLREVTENRYINVESKDALEMIAVTQQQ